MTKEFRHGGSSLSDEQSAFLIESGAFTPEELAETQASIARGELAEAERRTRQSAVKASLSAEEVATQLGIDVAQVEHRRADGSLFAFTTDGEHRYPTWQFTGDRRRPVLPGLARLIRAFPDDKHPASILGFMSTPQESLLVDNERLTPVEWLLQGGNPQRLVDILESFLQT